MPWRVLLFSLSVMGFAGAGQLPDVTLEIYQLQERHVPPQEIEKPWCQLDGGDGAMAILDPNVPLFRRLVVKPDDLREVVLRMKVNGKPAGLDSARVAFHRMLRKPGGPSLKGGEDYAAEPFLAVPAASHIQDGWLTVPGLAPALTEYVAGRWPDDGILMRLDSAKPASLRLMGVTSPKASWWGQNLPRFLVTVRGRENHVLFDWPVKPRDGVYCRLVDGRLTYGGQRLRLWGVCRGASHNPLQALRVKKMGSNAIRLWAGAEYSDESAKRGELDKAKMDKYDRYVAEMKRQGMWIMCPTLMRNACGIKTAQKGLLADDSWLAGGDDWQEWKKAITAKGAPTKFFYYFDERLMRIRKRHAENFLRHVNPHTGKAYGEEECIALFEIWNENGFLKWNLERGFASWPAYFRDKLARRWNGWLRGRYGDDAGLKKAWGRLEKGESLEGDRVALAPLVAQRDKFPKPRGDDFVRFGIELVDGSNQEFRAFCRTLAPKGVGVNVVPFSADTQYRMNTPWLYSLSRCEAVSFGLYYHQMQSTLGKPPSMGVLDSNTVKDRATVLYEVNTGHPNPYRTEFPIRLAALASWQDWDGVFFHYFQEPYWYWKRVNPDEQYLLETLPYQFNTADVMIETDPAFCSSSAAAAQMFLNHRLRPAPKPVVFQAGARAIFGYDQFNGIGMAHRTFTDGAVIEFKPESDTDVTVDGATPPEPEKIYGAVASGRELLWDWQRGRLLIDSPTVKAYVGKPMSHRFRGGIELSGMTTDFIVFAMVSADGKPLVGPDPARRIYLWSGWNNLNTGYEIDPRMLTRRGFVHPGERMKAVRKKGHPPIIADIVPYAVRFPTKLDYTFEGYDFALRKCHEIKGKDTADLQHDGRELFMGVLRIERRGEAVPPALVGSVGPVTPSEGTVAGRTGTIVAGAEVHPIPGLRWDMNQRETWLALAKAKFNATAVESKKGSLSLTGATALFRVPADIDFTFVGERMTKVQVSFTQAPPLPEVIADFTRRFGKPESQRMATQVYGTSTVQWKAQGLKVTVTDHQGTMGILFER